MSIAQHSVAGEGAAYPCAAEAQTADGDAKARAELTCDTTNLPWVIFRAAHRAAHLQGFPARSRALLAALARTVDAKRPYAAIYARREMLTGRAMQSMRTFYRSLDDLETAGLITRPPQNRYGEAGLFGRAYLHLTESAAMLLGLVTEKAPASQTAAPDAEERIGQEPQGDPLVQPSANVADGAIYKDLFPASQKRQPGTLPTDLQRLTSLGFHEFLVFKLMTEAKAHGKFLSDVVDVSWSALKKAYAPINYLRALLRKPVDFAYRARQLREATEQQTRDVARQAEVQKTIAQCSGQTFYNATATRRWTVSDEGTTLTIVEAAQMRIWTHVSGWQGDFTHAVREERLLPASDALTAAFEANRDDQNSDDARSRGKSMGAPRKLPPGAQGHLSLIKAALRVAGQGRFASVWPGPGSGPAVSTATA